MREKLIELIDEAVDAAEEACVQSTCVNCSAFSTPNGLCRSALVADILLANGVVIAENATTIQDSKLVEIDQFGKWIPVTERLPEGCKGVLVTDGKNILMAFYFPWDGTFRDINADGVFVVQNVTHWMPLPQPPKEGE